MRECACLKINETRTRDTMHCKSTYSTSDTPIYINKTIDVTGGKRFVCTKPGCTKAFVASGDLTVHVQRTPEKSRTYVIKADCGKAFETYGACRERIISGCTFVPTR